MSALREVAGPSAVGGGGRRFFNLLWVLTVSDLKLQFFGSVLGYLWQLMRPLLLFGTLYFVFTELLKIGEGVPLYGMVLLTNLVIFTFVTDATGEAVTSVVDREMIVRKTHFPRLVIPLSVVMRAYVNVLCNLAVVFVFIVAGAPRLNAGMLQLPLLLLALGVLCAGLAMLLSALYVRFRDLKPLWDVALIIIFYTSPIVYTVELISDQGLRELAMLNPLAAVLQQARHAAIDPGSMTAAEAAGGAERLLIPAGIALLVFSAGLWTFAREARHVAEDL